MKINPYLLLAASALLLTACSGSDDGTQEPAAETISLSATVGDDLTRAYYNLQGTRFLTGTDLLVEAYESGAASPYAKGRYTVQNTQGALAGSLTYPLLGGAVDLCAYYPATVTSASTSFTVASDQSTAAGYRQSDLMYAAKLTGCAKGRTHTLKFTHALSRIEVYVEPDTEKGVTWDDIYSNVGSVQVCNTVPEATLTVTNGTVTAAAAGGAAVHDIDITGSSYYHAGIVVPQTVTANWYTELIRFEYAGSEYSYYIYSNTTFLPGRSYQYTFTMSAAGLQLKSLTINDWQDDGTPTEGTL